MVNKVPMLGLGYFVMKMWVGWIFSYGDKGDIG